MIHWVKGKKQTSFKYDKWYGALPFSYKTLLISQMWQCGDFKFYGPVQWHRKLVQWVTNVLLNSNYVHTFTTTLYFDLKYTMILHVQEKQFVTRSSLSLPYKYLFIRCFACYFLLFLTYLILGIYCTNSVTHLIH